MRSIVKSIWNTRFVINMIAGLFLVLSQFTMSHAMSVSHTDHKSDCEVKQSMDHPTTKSGMSVEHLGLADMSTLPEGDKNSGSLHGNADHCATACAGALLATGIDSSHVKLVQIRVTEVHLTPTPASIQGLMRPPKS